MQPELTRNEHMLLETDVTGKGTFVHFVNITREHGEGWVDYMWPKPGIKSHLPKRSRISIEAFQRLSCRCRGVCRRHDLLISNQVSN